MKSIFFPPQATDPDTMDKDKIVYRLLPDSMYVYTNQTTHVPTSFLSSPHVIVCPVSCLALCFQIAVL